MPDPRPIGIFDSGVGGLTVVRAVLDLLPQEPVIYFGDTARFPYGPRSLEEIRGFAREITAYLLGRNVKLIVVACNSVQVAAMEDLTQRAGVPVTGVIDPGVRAALRSTRNGRVGVIGTEATINSAAYDRAVKGAADLFSAACPAFVPFVERGDTTSDELLHAARGYLQPLIEADIDTLILGCTHYPLLAGLLQEILGPGVVQISSAEETAKDVYGILRREALLVDPPTQPRHEFICSGDPGSFHELAARFLGPEATEVRAQSVQPAPLGQR